MKQQTIDLLKEWADEYNQPKYFVEDPIAFPREFVNRGASLQDIEIAAVFSSHLAWGRRAMIIRDCERLFEQMEWRPYDYVMSGDYRSDDSSIHRTVKWSEIAGICGRLREWYTWHDSLESLSAKEIRSIVFRRKEDPRAPDKKINLMRRWLVRCDGKVDLGLWKHIKPADLIIPLDVHVYGQAKALGLTRRRPKDLRTATDITDKFREIWPEDPVLGDFALFGYGVTHPND
ncbi:MAG: TIGR02757 family protein [Bacteroidales bacterium]|nr:TIGR02757 family protein [Bacteroidales bacterium]